MILHPDVQVIRDEYLLPYVGGTRKVYTYYLDRYQRTSLRSWLKARTRERVSFEGSGS